MLTLFIGRVAQLIIAVASMRLVTTLLDPAQLGQVSLVATLTALFALLLVNPVGMFINRRLHTWSETESLRPRLHAFFAYLGGVAALSGSLVATAVWASGMQIGMTAVSLAALVAGSLLFNTVIQTLVPSLNMLGRVRLFAVLTICGSLVNLALSVAFIRLAGPSAFVWMGGAVVGQALLSLLAYWLFFRGSPAGPNWAAIDRDQLKRLIAFSWPVAIAVGLAWAQMQGYRFLIAKQEGLVALGLFTAGYGIAAAMVSALEQILTTWFQPAFYRAANSIDPQINDGAWQHYASAMLPLSIVGMLALIASAPDLVALMLGPDFQTVTTYVVLGALAESTRVWVGVFTLATHMKLKTRLLLLPGVLGTLLTLSSMQLLLPTYGLKVAPLSVAAGGLLNCVWLFLSAVKGATGMLPVRRLLVASVAGAVAVAVAGLARPALYPLGTFMHPAAIALSVSIFAPLAWYFMHYHRPSELPIAHDRRWRWPRHKP